MLRCGHTEIFIRRALLFCVEDGDVVKLGHVEVALREQIQESRFEFSSISLVDNVVSISPKDKSISRQLVNESLDDGVNAVQYVQSSPGATEVHVVQ